MPVSSPATPSEASFPDRRRGWFERLLLAAGLGVILVFTPVLGLFTSYAVVLVALLFALRNLARGILAAAVVDDDIAALRGEAAHGSRSDTARRTGDDRDRAVGAGLESKIEPGDSRANHKVVGLKLSVSRHEMSSYTQSSVFGAYGAA